MHRYLDAYQFRRELEPLRAYPGEYVGDNLLESLEQARLVVPRLRIRYPDPIARRFWLEGHEAKLKHAVEPDGPRWEAAVDLANAMYRWRNPTVYGPSAHPLDDLEPCYAEFIERPATMPFQPWDDMRVDVSNDDDEPVLYDRQNVESLYSSWQVLLAAEVAGAGIHFRINLAEEGALQSAHEALWSGKSPGGGGHINLACIHVMREFQKHEKILDAVVRYAEEKGRALAEILRGQGGGRVRLTAEQSERYYQARVEIAQVSARWHQIGVDELVELSRFLSEQWSSWRREDRPAVAGAYRDFLAETVQMARQFAGLSFNDLRDLVGSVGGWRKPVLHAIWPDWAEEEKKRVRGTLEASFRQQPGSDIDSASLQAFVDFLASEGLEAFFWRLNSFENHAFRGNEFAVEGMRTDLQALAVAVEHLTVTLGGTRGQLDTNFKQLWRDPDVLRILNRADVYQLGRQKRLAQDWPGLKTKIEALRSEPGGNIAADLVMAYRIRGGVHQALPEDDAFELEKLFVMLMRAAALTFVEVRIRRRNAPALARGA